MVQRKRRRPIRRSALHMPIAIQLTAVCIGLGLIFWFCSPVRLGTQVRTAIHDITGRLIEASLFFELNPFLRTEPIPTADDTATPNALPAVAVIDIAPTDPPDTNRADTASRDIYEDAPSVGTATDTAAEPDDTEISYRNETSYTPDTTALLAADTFPLTEDGIQVLIVHTHTSESYTPDPQYAYTPDDNNRTLDPAYNVVRVGDALETRLTDAGISVIHDETIHDYPSYTGSYSRSLEATLDAMEATPGIDIVIDLHRDAMIGDDGTVYKTYASVEQDGQTLDSAQLMLVVGTDEGGLKHPDWEDNLAFAVKLQTTLDAMYPSLMRPINLRSERFNQHVTAGALLLEVGSSGNTLGEALTAVDLFADGLLALLGMEVV